MGNWNIVADEDAIKNTSENLTKNGFQVIVCENGQEAKEKVLGMIPEGSEVQANTSETLRLTGLMEHIDESQKFDSVRKKTTALDHTTQHKEIKIFRSVPDYAIGSAHAVTHNGEILIASNTGSQIPSYAYGANKAILVIGTQKLVANISDGIKRIYEHSLPLESERARKAYGTDGSQVNKILILSKEPVENRTTVILVKENLGY